MLHDEITEAQTFVQLAHQDQATVGSDARTLEIDLQRGVEGELKRLILYLTHWVLISCVSSSRSGHGPNFRLTRKVQGKTVTETFSSPAALRKAEREVAEFHRFQALSHDLVEVSEKICQLRPVEGEAGELSAAGKKRRK